jgi:hypothetical protein
MYPKAVAGAALPFTGLLLGWRVVAAAALVLAGMALLRMVPRQQGEGVLAARNAGSPAFLAAHHTAAIRFFHRACRAPPGYCSPYARL